MRIIGVLWQLAAAEEVQLMVWLRCADLLQSGNTRLGTSLLSSISLLQYTDLVILVSVYVIKSVLVHARQKIGGALHTKISIC